MKKKDKILYHLGNLFNVLSISFIGFVILLFIASSCGIGEIKEKLNEIPTPAESREK